MADTTLNKLDTANFFTHRSYTLDAGGFPYFGAQGDYFYNLEGNVSTPIYNAQVNAYNALESKAEDGKLFGTDGVDVVFQIGGMPTTKRPHPIPK